MHTNTQPDRSAPTHNPSAHRWLRAEKEGEGVAYECLETIAEAEHWVLALLALPPGALEEAPDGAWGG